MAKTTSKRPRRTGPPARRGPAARRPAAKKSPAQPAAKADARRSSPDDQLAEIQNRFRTTNVGDVLRAINAILEENPNHWPTIKYRFFVLWSIGQFDAALAVGKYALEQSARDVETQESLAAYLLDVAIRRAKENDRFIRPINAVIELTRGLADHPKMSGRLQLGLQYSLGAMHRHAEALSLGQKGLTLYPKYEPSFYYNNSFDLFQLGRHEEAIVSFGQTLKPLTSEANQAKPADRYKELAADYDNNRLHQSYPKLMARMIIRTAGATVTKRVLDAGCGTGSLGIQIHAARLVGIDRSPEMLAKARERNLYHELIEDDLVAAMALRTDRFDIIVSTVVLYHIADLAPYFREAARLLAPGGYLFFSTDPAPDSMEIGVSSPGEFAHSRAYVRRLAAETGFAEIAVKIMPHRGNPGFWWALRRA